MGSIIQFYIRTSALVLVAILILSFHSWSRKWNWILKQKATTLNQRIQERMQRGTAISILSL